MSIVIPVKARYKTWIAMSSPWLFFLFSFFFFGTESIIIIHHDMLADHHDTHHRHVHLHQLIVVRRNACILGLIGGSDGGDGILNSWPGNTLLRWSVRETSVGASFSGSYYWLPSFFCTCHLRRVGSSESGCRVRLSSHASTTMFLVMYLRISASST